MQYARLLASHNVNHEQMKKLMLLYNIYCPLREISACSFKPKTRFQAFQEIPSSGPKQFYIAAEISLASINCKMVIHMQAGGSCLEALMTSFSTFEKNLTIQESQLFKSSTEYLALICCCA